MLLCILKDMDFGVLEWAVLGNVILLLVLLVVLFYTICRLRKATRKNHLEETLPYSDTSDLVPQRYSTLCGMKSGNNRQNGISILSSTDPQAYHHQYNDQYNLRRMEKSGGRFGNFHLEKGSPTQMFAGHPTYFSATLPLPSKKNGGMNGMMPTMKVPMHWTPPPSYWIALPPTLAPAPQTSPFQYVGPYTTLPAVLKKQQRCRHERYEYRHNNSSRLRAIDSSSPASCMVVHNCGKKQVHMQEDL